MELNGWTSPQMLTPLRRQRPQRQSPPQLRPHHGQRHVTRARQGSLFRDVAPSGHPAEAKYPPDLYLRLPCRQGRQWSTERVVMSELAVGGGLAADPDRRIVMPP